MKKMLTAMSALCASVLFAAVPVIDQASVTVEQRGNRTVVISYDLNAATEGDAEPAIVTVDILTNAVGEAAESVGGEHLWTLSGDVNKIVQQGKRKILWSPHKEGMGEWTLPAVQVTVRVTAWSTNAPPAYWLIDLVSDASMKDRLCDRYYDDVAQIPGTITNKKYKTEWLPLRRVASAGVTWRQGASADDIASVQVNETLRWVSFSYDYYMAVFELTRGQYARLSRSFQYRLSFESTGATDDDFASARPLTGTPKTFQPNGIDASSSFNPAGSRIRDLSGNMVHVKNALGVNVDVPTVAEYEYACRAGTGNLWVSGDGDFGDYAWYGEDKGDAQQFHEVGLKLPNAWGFYDIQGNVQEFAIDWYYHDGSAVVTRPSDPVWDTLGPAKIGNVRSMFGGWYSSAKNDCRASYTSRMAPAQAMGGHTTNPQYNTGMRYVIIMP